MKILLLAFDFGLYGGVGTFNYELATELARRGVEVTVIIRGDKDSSVKYGRLEINTFRSPSIPPKDVTFFMLNANKITSLVKRNGFDVIHDSTGALALLPHLSGHASTVATIHGCPSLGVLRSVYGSLRDWIWLRLFDITHRLPGALASLIAKPRVDKLVFVSKSCLADALVHTPPEDRDKLKSKTTVIYNGLSVRKIRRQVGEVKGDSPDIVFVSRLMEYKGGARLIRAFRHVAKEIKDAKLHIVGSGPEEPVLKELAAKFELNNRVVFHGWLKRVDALKIMARSRLLTHPSLYESFGYVIAEAYALGKPVVAHRAPYSIELVEGFGSGLAVNTFNEREYAEALTTLLTDDGLYKRFSQRALAAAEEHFDIGKTAEGYIKVYKEAAGV
ncbi:glycosyltransferase family 4 protein [Thermoproteus tenax]|uniref:N-acetylglucosaminyl-phosphatidylinositol biosynthetic protein n=1 Tax=Thermoproteus tenax (strain ATCC 35583 / DSM 2078 / JCM 9277 / NBRC 100435 / Kra 1) TaxID=768679 RepID=G4RKA1_THETK|nr:glycosyltransferase family 4 protein [Thermoproteus tenax]CCC81996.1 N-acetylglucosaminyl-phosphatidylinositol biosynthetic protein [Thermoproteus tenax Kra 1]